MIGPILAGLGYLFGTRHAPRRRPKARRSNASKKRKHSKAAPRKRAPTGEHLQRRANQVISELDRAGTLPNSYIKRRDVRGLMYFWQGAAGWDGATVAERKKINAVWKAKIRPHVKDLV